MVPELPFDGDIVVAHQAHLFVVEIADDHIAYVEIPVIGIVAVLQQISCSLLVLSTPFPVCAAARDWWPPAW